MIRLFLSMFLLFTASGVFAQEDDIFSELENIRIGSLIPVDIAIKYFGAKTDYSGDVQPTRLEYYKRHGEKAAVIVNYQTGVMDYSLLQFVNVNGLQEDKKYQLEMMGDHDGISALAESLSYSFINDSIIEVEENKEIVKDSSLYDHETYWMKRDTSFWDVETVSCTTYKYLILDSKLKVHVYKPNSNICQERMYKEVSQRVLPNKKLKEYSKRELRIMRNEIFAAYGYKFKSKDLRDYFTATTWYEPKYDDVTTKLSQVERLNIAAIIKIERE
jgi:hypothetical protein